MFKIIFKISVILVLVTILPIYFSTRTANRIVQENLMQDIDNNAVQLSSILDNFIRDYQSRLLLTTTMLAQVNEILRVLTHMETEIFMLPIILDKYRKATAIDMVALHDATGIELGRDGFGISLPRQQLAAYIQKGANHSELYAGAGSVIFYSAATVGAGQGLLVTQFLLGPSFVRHLQTVVDQQFAFFSPQRIIAATPLAARNQESMEQVKQVFQTGDPVYTDEILEEKAFRGYYFPLRNDQGAIVCVIALYNTIAHINLIREQTEESLENVASIAISVALFAGLLFSLGITRPIKKLLRWTRLIAEGKLESSVKVRSHDEIGRLARSFNTMRINLIEQHEQLEEAALSLKESVNQLQALTIITNHLQKAKSFKELVYILLSGITCREGLGQNRAAYLSIEGNRIRGVMGIGFIDEKELLRNYPDMEAYHNDSTDIITLIDRYKELNSRMKTNRFFQNTKKITIKLSDIQEGSAFFNVLKGQNFDFITKKPFAQYGKDLEKLLNLDAYLACPVMRHTEIIGILLIDNYFDNKKHMGKMLEPLMLLLSHFNTVLVNVFYFNEIKTLNRGLERKVQLRTRELEEARREAVEANKNKSRFLANMSHELRTPLNAIKGVAELLKFGSFSFKRPMIKKIKEMQKLLNPKDPAQKEISETLEEILTQLRVNKSLEELPFKDLHTKASKLGAQGKILRQDLDAASALITKETQETANAYDRIRESSNFLLEIINKALDLAKIEAGKFEVHKTTALIQSLIEDVQRYADNYTKGKGKTDIQINTLLDPELPETWYFDELLTKQVLLNLLSNAIKYSEKGIVELRVRMEKTNIHFSVSDEGMGIREEEKRLIFSEFGRTREGMTMEGTGLGLALSKQLIERQGGSVGFTSKFGKGSVFYFTLPPRTVKSHTKPSKGALQTPLHTELP